MPEKQAERLQVEWVAVERLHLNPANPRINDQAVPHVAASIRRFGWQQPVVARRSGEVIAGNTRLKAARELGHPEVPVVWFEGTDLEATAFSIADNRTHEFATWDLPSLTDLLAELRAEDALEGVGYTPEDIDRLLDELQAQLGAGDIVEDEVPEPPDKATSQRGDLWVLGRHRLLCGDAGSVEDVDRLLGGAKVHLVNTDPPYNVKVEPRSNNAIAAGLSSFSGVKHHQKLDLARHPEKSRPTSKKLRPKDRPLENDFLSDEEFSQKLRAWFGNIARVLIPGRAAYIWGGYSNLGNFPSALAECGLYFSQAIVWNKLHPVLTRKDFLGCFELAFYSWREGAAHVFLGPNNAPDLWEIKKVTPTKMSHLCLHPDAEVLTIAGYRQIRSIKVGDRVFSGDGTFHRVEHVSSHRYTSEHLYRITAKGGNVTTDASDNHPFLIWRPKRRGARFVGGEVVWLRADELKAGDYTMTPLPVVSGHDPFPETDDDYWFLFGLYLAQGHLQNAGHGGRSYPAFTIHKKRQDLAERIWRQWPGAREYDRSDYEAEPSSALTVMAFDGDSGRQFEKLGGRLAHGKRMAPEVLALPRSKRLAVLQGWLNGDGCKVHDRAYWQGSTVSADLAAHLSVLAESVGYRANVYSYDPPDDLGGIRGRRFKSRRRVYCLYFYERIQLARRGPTLWMEHEGREYSLRQVKRVEQIRYEGDVWNLSIEGHPSFQTAVGLSHNTEKPVELAARAIQYSSRSNENVLDLFGGSGSTLMACEQTGRNAFLTEIDTPYADVIVERWQRFTGQKAMLEGTDQTFEQVAAKRAGG